MATVAVQLAILKLVGLAQEVPVLPQLAMKSAVMVTTLTPTAIPGLAMMETTTTETDATKIAILKQGIPASATARL
jgi:hypothetical protein